MILHAYMDESGTHGGSVATVMGGIMANTSQWDRLEGKFRALKKQFGFSVFHTKTFKDRDGDFKNWSREKKIQLLDAMANIGDGAFMSAVTMAVINAEYDRDYKRTPDVPRKIRMPSKYGLCFERCLSYFIFEAAKRQFRGRYPQLHIICESGAANAGDAVRIFNETRERLFKEGTPILQTITFADKRDTDPLMFADFFAHTRWMHLDQNVPITDEMILPPGSNQTAVTALTYKPGALQVLKSQQIKEFQSRRKKRGSP